MSHDPPHYQPNQPDSFDKLPSVDTGYIPPPKAHLTDVGATLELPEGSINPITRHDDQYGSLNFLNFLGTFTQSTLSFAHTQHTWKYRERHKAHQVLPFLYLGPLSSARDQQWISQANISMIVAVRSKQAIQKQPKFMDPARLPTAQGLETATIDMDSALDLVSSRRRIIRLINDHLEATCRDRNVTRLEDIPGKVLVFCETGNHRSAMVVILYLMIVWGFNAVTASQVVQGARFGTFIDSEMVRIFQDLELYLDAERQISEGSKGVGKQHPTVEQSTKRTHEEFLYTGIEMTGDTVGSESSRPGIAPYKDRSV